MTEKFGEWVLEFPVYRRIQGITQVTYKLKQRVELRMMMPLSSVVIVVAVVVFVFFIVSAREIKNRFISVLQITFCVQGFL